MATVTGLTAARMLAIEAASVVGGEIDENGHLILTTHGGTEIDGGPIFASVPNASESARGIVELATSAEVISGVDAERAVTPAGLASKVASETARGIIELATTAETVAGTDTARAVTPAGLASVSGPLDIRLDILEAVPGNKVQTITAPTEASPPASYPEGVSICSVGSGTAVWSPNGGFGTIVTNRISTDRCSQTFYANSGGSAQPVMYWVRIHHTSGGWTNWVQALSSNILIPANFNQSTHFANYPYGISYLYLSAAQSVAGSWSWGSKFAFITTYRLDNDFVVQTYQKHQGGTGGETELWQRTANSPSGWSNWRVVVRDAKLPDPIVASYASTNTVTATSWANLQNDLVVGVNFPYDCIVSVSYNVWMHATATTNVRSGISFDGGTPNSFFGGSWGNVPYVSNDGDSHQRSFTAQGRISAGAHTFRARAYVSGGSAGVNYPNIMVTPIRWAD